MFPDAEVHSDILPATYLQLAPVQQPVPVLDMPTSSIEPVAVPVSSDGSLSPEASQPSQGDQDQSQSSSHVLVAQEIGFSPVFDANFFF